MPRAYRAARSVWALYTPSGVEYVKVRRQRLVGCASVLSTGLQVCVADRAR